MERYLQLHQAPLSDIRCVSICLSFDNSLKLIKEKRHSSRSRTGAPLSKDTAEFKHTNGHTDAAVMDVDSTTSENDAMDTSTNSNSHADNVTAVNSVADTFAKIREYQVSMCAYVHASAVVCVQMLRKCTNLV